MSDDRTRSEALEHLAELIDGFRSAMLTTVEPDGTLRSRPMGLQTDGFDGTLWFFTRESSPKVDQIEARRTASVAFADPGANTYVSMAGHARIVHDRERMAELWHPLLKAWFPDGLDDPELVLIAFEAERAEYWSSPSTGIVYALGVAKALATGEPADDVVGENEKLDL